MCVVPCRAEGPTVSTMVGVRAHRHQYTAREQIRKLGQENIHPNTLVITYASVFCDTGSFGNASAHQLTP
jgi:hypothetical protein